LRDLLQNNGGHARIWLTVRNLESKKFVYPRRENWPRSCMLSIRLELPDDFQVAEEIIFSDFAASGVTLQPGAVPELT
jgi:hypothetical protein